MKNLTGIKSLLEFNHSDVSEIKKYLLLFDSVGAYDVRKRIEQVRKKHNHKHVCSTLIAAQQLEHLVDKGLLRDIELKGHAGIRNEDATPENMKTFYSLLQGSQQLFDNDSVQPDIKFDAYNRLQSFILNIEDPPHPFEAIPIVRQFTLPDKITAEKKDIINLVIEQFPTPSEEIPLDKLVEFKNDADNFGRLAGLRSWINSLSKSGMTLGEVNDELQYKLYQYQKSLEAHKIKYQTGIVETFIVNGADLLENVVKLKLGEVARTFFRAKELKADLLLAELNSPGHELGYIYKVRNEYTQRG